jgi:acyl-coenzyme A synthetase/AMP-(fatty) acid ligase
VPSVWRPVLRHEAARLADLAGQIRGVLFSGEPFPLPALRQLRQALPRVRVVNCFGPTEVMACTLGDVPDPLPVDAEPLSIGHAYQGAEILLIDEHGNPVDEPGVVGEIHLRGPSLFSGYWGDEQASRAALVPDPLNSSTGQVVYRSGDLACFGERRELYFLGRVDHQVKIRGNRVELGEIERRLLEYPGVVAAAAVARPDAAGDSELIAFVVTEQDRLDETDVSTFCGRTLPDYMVPARVVRLSELPTNANGKIDRRALATSSPANALCRSESGLGTRTAYGVHGRPVPRKQQSWQDVPHG